jgi:hypothetical protein
MPQNDFGIIYVAFGYEYVLMALHSAKTASITNPDCKYAIVTNSHISEIEQINSTFCSIDEVDLPDNLNRSVKTSVDRHSPFTKTLLLDCDTEVNGDLTPMFQCLERFDAIAKLNAEPTMKEFSIAEKIPGSVFPIWNTGAIFFNSGPRAHRLFSEWNRIFLEMQGNRDQPAFARTIYENPDIKLLSVNCIWNMGPIDKKLFVGKRSRIKSKIWHYQDPRQYLSAARAIYKLHTDIGPFFLESNLGTNVGKIGSRYAAMLKARYRAPLVGKLFLNRHKKALKRLKKTAGLRFKKK